MESLPAGVLPNSAVVVPTQLPAGPPAADVGGSNHPQKRIRKDGLGGRPSSTLYSGLGFAAPITNNKNILALRRALNAPSVILTMGTDGISSLVSNGGNTRDVVGGADGVSARYE